jgi:hypothetical protein
VPSWRAEPKRLTGAWLAYRQASPDTAPLFHAAGEPHPSQRSGRWHHRGEGYAQYMALEAQGAWCELIRYEGIRADPRAAQYTKRLWLIYAVEHDIADLSRFADWEACGLDPRTAVAEHEPCQQLARELRAAGYRGVLSPSAALADAVNLTLFGERYEKMLRTQPERWENPQPGLRLPCNLVAEAGPPGELITETCFPGMQHDGYRQHLRDHGKAEPGGTP